jgi:hypothetical protein
VSINWASELSKLTNRAPTLETVLTHSDYFGLVDATALQRAICRALTGKPLGELADHPHVRQALGSWTHTKPPKEFYFAAGIRSGKSLLNAAIMAYVALTADFAKTKVRVDRGEIPRISVVSTQKDVAQATMSHFIGTCEKSPILKKCLVRTKYGYTFIQPHTGHPIEVVVVANKKQGSSLVARWQLLVLFDEISRMASANTSVINVDEARAGALARIVDGGYMIGTGSPTAPVGLFYRMITDYLHKNNSNILAVQAQGEWLNPSYWNKAQIDEVRERDPDVYITDCLGQFASPVNSLFPLNALDKAIRKGPDVLPPKPGLSYIAGMDPGLSSNSWTLVVGTREGNIRKVALAKEWIGTKLKPNNAEAILHEMSELLEPYGVSNVATDQYGFELLRQTGVKFGLNLFQRKMPHEEKQSLYVNIQNLLVSGRIELPDNPQLKLDLLRTKKIPLQSGGYTIQLPQTSDGRHCDYVPALLLALGDHCRDAEPWAKPKTDYAANLERAIEKDVEKKVRKSVRDSRRKVSGGGW